MKQEDIFLGGEGNAWFTLYSHRVAHHTGDVYTDDRQEWVATSVLRKCRPS
jgi:hypothetical protein